MIVCNTANSYEKICKELPNIKCYELYHINHSMGENAIVLAPNSEDNFINYSNIVFVDAPLCMEYISHVAMSSCRVYVVDSKFNLSYFTNLNTARHIFGIYNNIIKDFASKNLSSCDLPNTFKLIKKLNPQNSYLTYSQFYFVVLVLSELGIINVDGGNITYDNTIQSNLKNSTIYNFISQLLNIGGNK